MNISEIHFYHGWGFDSEFWKSWIRDGRFTRYHVFDRGYTGHPVSPSEFRSDSDVRIIVAHSLGLHFIPENILSQAGLLVVCGGFDRFHSGKNSAGHRKVVRMINRFAAMPMTVLTSFYTNCMHPADRIIGSPGKVNFDLLEHDLNFLNECRLEHPDVITERHVLLFHGKEDIIVPLSQAGELHKLLPASRLIEIAGAGHMIPITHRDLIYRNISGLLAYTRLN
jgi:hypothetical protein